MLRLGHISFFGIGFLNLGFGLTVEAVSISPLHTQVASIAMILGAATMPLLCFLTAWRETFRHLFPVPVVSVLVATIALLTGWTWQ